MNLAPRAHETRGGDAGDNGDIKILQAQEMHHENSRAGLGLPRLLSLQPLLLVKEEQGEAEGGRELEGAY